jgi:hypothetical protein
MTDAAKIISKEKQLSKIFDQIAGVPDPQTRIAIPGTGIADPGDLLFFITHHPDMQSLYKNRPRTLKELVKRPLEPFFRRYYGFAKDDFDGWHVGIYFMGKKRKRHQRINLWMFHSHPASLKEKGGVHVQHLSPTALVKEPSGFQVRMEILQFKGISKEQRKKIKDRVNPKYPYLMDHHIYRDPRFEVKAAVHQNLNTNEFHLETGNLEKYSWNQSLRNKYLSAHMLHS